MVGIENIKKIALLGAEGINVGVKMMNGGGLFSLMSLVDDVSAVKNIRKDVLAMELKDISKEERLELVSLIKEKVSLENQQLDKKIDGGLDILNEAIELGYSIMNIVESGKQLVERAEQIIKG